MLFSFVSNRLLYRTCCAIIALSVYDMVIGNGDRTEVFGIPLSSSDETELLQFYKDGSTAQVPEYLQDSLSVINQIRPVDKGTVHGILARYFAGEGYFSARTDSISYGEAPGSSLRVYTSPGCRFTIGSLGYHVKDNDSNLLEGMISFYGEGDFYAEVPLEEELRRYVRHIEKLGYPLATLEITEFIPDLESCEVSLVVDVVTGEKLHAAGVWTRGLSQHNPDYIETATGIRQNDLITPDLFQRGRRNLENTDLFHEVSDGDIVIRDGEPYVYYQVSERRANHFDLMFGYVPEQVSGYQIVGSGHMLIRNVGWSGSTMDLSFDRLDNMVTQLDVEYGRQWIMGMPAGASLGFRFLQQDTSYQVREWRSEGSWNLSPERKILLHMRQENAVSGDETPMSARVLDGVTRSAGFGFHYDNRDSRLNPTLGRIFHLYVESGFRRVTDSRVEELQSVGTMMQQRVKTFIQIFYSPFPRHVVSPKITGSVVESPEYTETDLIRLGGSRSIRGYREEQFRVSRTAWSDVEYRYLLDAYSHAFLFAAGGIYEQPKLIGQDRPGETEWLHSGGFGFRYRTPIGIMQFTYAVSGEDPLHNGKVHFSLSAQF